MPLPDFFSPFLSTASGGIGAAQFLALADRHRIARSGGISSLTPASRQKTMPHGFFRRRNFRRFGARRGFRRARTISSRSMFRRGRSQMPSRLAATGLSRGKVMAIGRPLFNKAATFPQSFTTKIVTGDIFRVNVGVVSYPTFGTLARVHLNSAFKPLTLPATAQQALFYDQLKAIYNKTVVLAAKVTVQIVEGTVSSSYKLTSTLDTEANIGAASAGPTDAQATSDTQNTFAVFHAEFDQRIDHVAITRYVNMSRFFGRKVKQDSDFTERGAEIAATKDRCEWKLLVRRLDATDLASEIFSYRINITQWVEFGERKKVADT